MKVLRVIHQYVGIRAEGMILIAAIWTLIGVQILMESPPNPPPDSVLYYLLPTWFRFALWTAPALAAAALSLSPRWSAVGLALLTIAPVQRCVAWMWSGLMSSVPDGPAGYALGWYNALIWFCVALLPMYLSHIPARARHLDGVPE